MMVKFSFWSGAPGGMRVDEGGLARPQVAIADDGGLPFPEGSHAWGLSGSGKVGSGSRVPGVVPVRSACSHTIRSRNQALPPIERARPRERREDIERTTRPQARTAGPWRAVAVVIQAARAWCAGMSAAGADRANSRSPSTPRVIPRAVVAAAAERLAEKLTKVHATTAAIGQQRGPADPGAAPDRERKAGRIAKAAPPAERLAWRRTRRRPCASGVRRRRRDPSGAARVQMDLFPYRRISSQSGAFAAQAPGPYSACAIPITMNLRPLGGPGRRPSRHGCGRATSAPPREGGASSRPPCRWCGGRRTAPRGKAARSDSQLSAIACAPIRCRGARVIGLRPPGAYSASTCARSPCMIRVSVAAVARAPGGVVAGAAVGAGDVASGVNGRCALSGPPSRSIRARAEVGRVHGPAADEGRRLSRTSHSSSMASLRAGGSRR